MKICLYTNSALPKLGGQEAVVDSLAREFLKLGHEPTVLAPRPRLPLLPRDQELPYPVIRHPRFFSTRHFVSWYRVFLSRAATRSKFDIVHCHDVYPTGYVAALCREKLGIPLVITSHGGDVRAGNARLIKSGILPKFLRTIATADTLISIGNFTTEGFLQLGADLQKIILIPNGVDLAPFAHSRDPELIEASGNYFLFLGRLSHRKGVDVLLSAIALLPAGAELVIAGTGDEQSNIEHQIQSLKLSGRVRLVGRVTGDEKINLLQNCRAVVVPSRGWEAFPLVVMEAFAAGRPVIGSRIAGIQDLITPEKTGLLFESESSHDLADMMRKLIDEDDAAQKMGLAARNYAADFSWNKIAARHIELYQKLAQKNAPGGLAPGALY